VRNRRAVSRTSLSKTGVHLHGRRTRQMLTAMLSQHSHQPSLGGPLVAAQPCLISSMTATLVGVRLAGTGWDLSQCMPETAGTAQVQCISRSITGYRMRHASCAAHADRNNCIIWGVRQETDCKTAAACIGWHNHSTARSALSRRRCTQCRCGNEA
jgi:hypothetical protein